VLNLAIDIVTNDNKKITVEVELIGNGNSALMCWKCEKNGKSVWRKKEFKQP
jgi:hypothetical protein